MGTVVHEALHGYSEGHRQFACSADLTVKDSRLVLVMSDASGSGVTAEGVSYLTGYPLQESGLYALARTWPAPEMPRPGCVWTHTLFIEFSDLAVLDSPSLLAQLFRRPSVEMLKTYGASLQMTGSQQSHGPLLPGQVSLFERLASALYEHPNEQVWARRTGDGSVDDVVLRLWDLQWPRLRRSFRFCTLTPRDRSQEGSPFDLQLCGDSVSRLRFALQSEGVEANSTSDEPWLTQLVEYADRPAASGFREVLRLLGTDVLGGREAMRSICSLQAALARQEPSAVADAIALVQSTAPLSSSKVAQEMVVSAALSRSDELSPDVMSFVVGNLDLVDERELAEHSGKLAILLWSTVPAKLVELLYDKRLPIRSAMSVAVHGIDASVLAQNLVVGADWTWKLLGVRPDLTEVAEFWKRTQACASDIQKAGVSLQGEAQLQAAVLGLSDPVAIESIAHSFGSSAVLNCLQRLTSDKLEVHQLRKWVKQACCQVGDVASFLAHSNAPTSQLVMAIANELGPDAVPNDYGVDPWFTALIQMRDALHQLPLEVLAYGFQRALSWRSRSVGPLLRLTFDPLHCAATDGALAGPTGQHLRDSLPWVRPGDSWDIALRLRLGVAKRCVDAPVAAEDFVGLTSVDHLFELILEETWEHWGGKRYLKKVDEAMRNTADAQLAPRCRQLVLFLDRNSRWWM